MGTCRDRQGGGGTVAPMHGTTGEQGYFLHSLRNAAASASSGSTAEGVCRKPERTVGKGMLQQEK